MARSRTEIKHNYYENVIEKIGCLFPLLAFCVFVIYQEYPSTDYDNNYDSTVGGGRISVTTPFIITSYLQNQNQCNHGKYQLVGKRYNYISTFETICVIDNDVCYQEYELLENYKIGTIHNISYDKTKSNECSTIKHTSELAKQAYSNMCFKQNTLMCFIGYFMFSLILLIAVLRGYTDKYFFKMYYFFNPIEKDENVKELRMTPIATSDVLQQQLDNVCCICVEPLKHGNIVVLHNCGHLFHQTCAKNHFEFNSRATCPTCRANVNQYDV